MLNLYIGYCQKLYTQHCHFLYIVNLLITFVYVKENYAYCKALKFAQKKIADFSGKLHLINTFFFKDFDHVIHFKSS